MRVLFVPLFVVVAASLAFAQDPAVLKRVPKEGDAAKYKITVDTEVSGMTIKFQAKMTEKVTKVREDGSYTVSSEQSDQTLNINGQDSPMPAQVGSPSTTTYLPDGTISDIQGEQVDSSAMRMANIQTVVWPKDPVGAGSKWAADIKGNKDKGTIDVHCTYEVQAKEQVGSHSALKIAFECKETSGADPASTKGTVWLDAATGLMLKIDGQWVNAPISGVGPINGKVLIEIAE